MKSQPVTIILGVFLLAHNVSAAPPTKEIVIGPDSSVKVRKDNVFLAASDKQFRPIAEMLDAAEKNEGSMCTTRVFKGMNSNSDAVFKNPNYFVQSGNYRRDMLESQDLCARRIRTGARDIGQAMGLLNEKTAWIKDQHIFDPRVYERAKKMVPKASSPKPKD